MCFVVLCVNYYFLEHDEVGGFIRCNFPRETHKLENALKKSGVY